MCIRDRDEAAAAKAQAQGITVLSTQEPVFETALTIYRLIQDESVS